MRNALLAALLATTAAIAGPALAQERVLRLDESPVGEVDPAKGVDYADTVLAINLYESLVYPTRGGPGVEPMLATEWAIEGLDYTFTLREAAFSSGHPLTAADVVYSFHRLMAMGQGSANLFEGRVASVEAVDDRTVRFTLSEPFAPFLAALSRLWIVDSVTVAEHYGEGTFGEFGDYAGTWLSQNSAGSGAYTVQSHDPQTETVLVPNPSYAGEVDPLAPELVRYRYGLEASTVRALMSRGEHDISSLWLPPEVLKAMADEGTVHLAPEPGGAGEYISLNTRRPPLDDVHCRLALMHAYDYATTIQLLQVTPDMAQGVPMNGALPQGLTGHDPEGPAFVQDMEAAQAELAQCQYDPAEYPLDIAWVAEVPARERLALLMQATFSQLGFPVNVVRTPWALVTEQVTDPATAPHAVEIQVSTLTPDPDSLIYNMYSSTVPSTWMSAAYLVDEEVDRLLQAGRTEVDVAKRAEIYGQLNDRLTALAPAIFAYEFTGVYAIRNGVEVPALEDPAQRYSLSGFNLQFKDVRITD